LICIIIEINNEQKSIKLLKYLILNNLIKKYTLFLLWLKTKWKRFLSYI